MRFNIFALIAFIFFLNSCQDAQKEYFDESSLAQQMFNTDMESTDLQSVLEDYKGEKVILKIWASWCADCIKSFVEIQRFQRENPEIPFIFISVDDSEEQWKNGLAKYVDRFEIKAEQYFFQTGWTKNGENQFIDYINLTWIPRYMLIDENGKIEVFNAKDINSRRLQNQIY